MKYRISLQKITIDRMIAEPIPIKIWGRSYRFILCELNPLASPFYWASILLLEISTVPAVELYH